MLVADFIKRVAAEPDRTVDQTVWRAPPEVLAKAAQPGGLRLTEFLSAPGRRAEQRNIRYGHVLGAPASAESIEAWEAQHRASQPLPADLRAMLTHINGIHLWADAESGRSYEGLAPVEEWELARTKMSSDSSLLDDRYVAISYHQEGAAFVVLDVRSGTYYLMDAAGHDTTSPIATSAGELLDWLWQRRIAPKT